MIDIKESVNEDSVTITLTNGHYSILKKIIETWSFKNMKVAISAMMGVFATVESPEILVKKNNEIVKMDSEVLSLMD